MGDIRERLRRHARKKMSDGTILLVLSVFAGLAFGFGIWAGLGYPGLYDKYARTGRAPRQSPLSRLLKGGRRPLTSEVAASARPEDEGGEDVSQAGDAARPSFRRGRRFTR